MSIKLSEYCKFDAVGLREAIHRGDVSVREVLEASQQSTLAVNDRINALAMPLFEEPLHAEESGRLYGVPFFIKDIGPFARGVPFTGGNRQLAGSIAPRDHAVMGRFRSAGLCAIGASATPEFSIAFATDSVLRGPTRNPWNLSRGAGGSSGGAAALVAAGAVPIAHANDAAGSIRVPAASTGVVGLKPSRGRTPSGPYEAESTYGTSSEFIVARTMRDVALVLDLLAGPARGERYSAPLPERPFANELGVPSPLLRVGLIQSVDGLSVNEEISAATKTVARFFEEAGHQVDTVALPACIPDLVTVFSTLSGMGVGSAMESTGAEITGESFEAVSLALYKTAKARNSLEVAAGLAVFNEVMRSIGSMFEQFDLLLSPVLAQLPPEVGVLNYNDSGYSLDSWLTKIFEHAPFTPAFNIGGQPAMSVPVGHSSTGLPIGVQLVADYGREDLLIRLGAMLETAIPWSSRYPSVHASL